MIDIGIKNAVAYLVGGKIIEDETESVLSAYVLRDIQFDKTGYIDKLGRNSHECKRGGSKFNRFRYYLICA